MRNRAIIPVYLLELFVILISTLFFVMHWPGGFYLLLFNFALEIILILLMAREIYSSDRVSKTKVIWIAAYCLIVPVSVAVFLDYFEYAYLLGLYVLALEFVSGLIYLVIGRRLFAPRVSEIERIKFDSI